MGVEGLFRFVRYDIQRDRDIKKEPLTDGKFQTVS